MKHLTIRRMACFLAALGCATLVSAHDGRGTLGVAPSATDLHLITCNDDGSGTPHHLVFDLTGGKPAKAPTVSAQIQLPDQQIAFSVTDPVNGDKGSSRVVSVPGGASVYQVTVGKSGLGKATYSFTYHCETRSGAHTGTDFTTLQNQ